MSHWPPVAAMEAIGCVQLFHVCTVDLRNTSECVILKALVRNPENAHSAWVATKKSGDIVAAHWEREEGE